MRSAILRCKNSTQPAQLGRHERKRVDTLIAFGSECQLRQAKMSKGMASELRKHIAILSRPRRKGATGAPKSAQCGCRVARADHNDCHPDLLSYRRFLVTA